MLGRLVAILTFSRRSDSLTGPAKVIDVDTIVVADRLVRLHGIDAPRTGPDVPVAGSACGTMALAALKALVIGVKVRCEAVERDGPVVKVFSPKGVDIGRRLVSAGCTGGTRRTMSPPRTTRT